MNENLKARYEYVADFINKNNYKKIVEIGIEAGATAEYILANCPNIEKYYGIDIVKPHNFPDETFNKFLNFALIIESGHEVSQQFEDKSLDLVYIDGNHNYENVIEDITDWLPKIREGGIICGHDYSKHYYPSVIRAVNEKFPEGINLLLECFNYGLPEPDDHIWWKKL
jgi:predicted O-methyltransferase YrrM